jgi:hypothetical protein
VANNVASSSGGVPGTPRIPSVPKSDLGISEIVRRRGTKPSKLSECRLASHPAKKFSMSSTRCRVKNPHFVSMMPLISIDAFG